MIQIGNTLPEEPPTHDYSVPMGYEGSLVSYGLLKESLYVHPTTIPTASVIESLSELQRKVISTVSPIINAIYLHILYSNDTNSPTSGVSIEYFNEYLW